MASYVSMLKRNSSDKRRGLLVIGLVYHIFRAIQDIEVVGLEMKSWISPTKLEFCRAKKTCDIISPSAQGRGVVICYKSQ